MTYALVADKGGQNLFIAGVPWARTVNRQVTKYQLKNKTRYRGHFLILRVVQNACNLNPLSLQTGLSSLGLKQGLVFFNPLP